MERTLFEPEHDLFRESYRKFLEQEVAPFHEQWEKDKIVDREVWKKAGARGFWEWPYPKSSVAEVSTTSATTSF